MAAADSAGHRRGTMWLRWVGALEHADPTARVIPFQEPERSAR